MNRNDNRVLNIAFELFGNVMNIDRFYEENAIIRAPDKSVKKLRHMRVLADSRFRDLELYPSSSEYVMDLEEPIDNIITAELVNYKVPSNSYMISKVNNMLYFCEDPVQFTVQGSITPLNVASIKKIAIPSGNYQPADLAAKMESLINDVSRGTIVVTYDNNSQLFSFRSNLVDKTSLLQVLGFSLTFAKPNTCARIIGFYEGIVYYGAVLEPVTVYYNGNIITVNSLESLSVNDPIVLSDINYTLANSIKEIDASNKLVQLTNLATTNIFNGSLNHGKITAPAKYLPIAVANDDYILLEIDQFSTKTLPVTSPAYDAFAILSSGFNHVAQTYPYVRHFRPKVSLSRLNIKFKNFDGQLCDFENNENFLEIILTVERHPHPYG